MSSLTVVEQCRRARLAGRAFALSTSEARAQILRTLADELERSEEAILAANAQDLERAHTLSAPLRDRLMLNRGRLAGLRQSVLEIAAFPDPIGTVISETARPNGLHVQRVRVPLGVIAIIYESRPNVTIDAAALALKTGNAIVLRGGSEARSSNEVFEAVVHRTLVACGVSPDVVQLLQTQERAAVRELVRASEYVDLAIPRGGEALIREVVEHATVPVVQHYKGVCHMVLDVGADLATSTELVLNAKMSRPSVCNALECLLVLEQDASRVLPSLLEAMMHAGCEVRGCPKTRKMVPACKAATAEDFGMEFLAPTLAVKVVDDLDGALAHIAAFGSGHTEAIVSPNAANVERFVRSVDAACVVANASTRFHDGGELGLGAEMGIATSRLHWRGPMGIESLTTMKWVVTGTGQVRR